MRDGTPTITSPGIVIIDEVDAHLHVSWQKRIGGWLKTHFPNIQFIVTTHSPYICQSADPGGLIRLPGPQEDEPPRVVEQALYDRIVFGSGEDAVLSELFGLDSPYSEQADELRSKAIALEGKVVTDRASEQEIEDYLELRRRLNSSPATRAREVEARLEASEDDEAWPDFPVRRVASRRFRDGTGTWTTVRPDASAHFASFQALDSSGPGSTALSLATTIRM
jgi:predicted ATP-binding protein involved in virulence